MKLGCLVNNYNYARFVGEAVESALRQTVPFDEIIVVDDGSTDGSLELLERQFGQHPRVRFVAKRNEGQLSCFNEGFARSTADILFFLDADDVYEPNYIERALEVYCREPAIDFVFCGRRLFGDREGVELEFPEDRDLGYSVVRTAYLCEWIGASTSCLSMRRNLLESILPLPFLESWRTRADDCLVFGSSLAGGRKYFLAEPLVRYRTHATNHFCGRKSTAREQYFRRLAMNVLFEHLQRKLGYNAARFGDFHHREFRTIPRPTLRDLLHYYSINYRAPISLVRRLTGYAALTAHFLGATWGNRALAERRTDEVLSEPFAPSLRKPQQAA